MLCSTYMCILLTVFLFNFFFLRTVSARFIVVNDYISSLFPLIFHPISTATTGLVHLLTGMSEVKSLFLKEI